MSDYSSPEEEDYFREMQEQYREETGEELPDHVLENYDEFFSLGPTLEDIEKARERGQRMAPQKYTIQEFADFMETIAIGAGALGLVAGLTIGLSLGALLL